MHELALPPEIPWPKDLRWVSDDRLLVAGGRDGVFELRLDRDQRVASWHRLIAPDDEVWIASHLAVDPPHQVAIAAPVFTVHRRDLATNHRSTLPFAAVLDLDVFGERLAVLGTRSGPEGAFAPEGTILWSGADDELRGILGSAAGEGARPVDACGIIDVGSLRFLPDGSLLAVPGVEEGIFWFSPAGRLLQAWRSRDRGISSHCDLDDDAMRTMSLHPEARWRWIQERNVVDDVLPVRDAPGILVRHGRGEHVRWTLYVLARGKAAAYEVPVADPTIRSRIRGDSQGDRVALLVTEPGRPELQSTPNRPSRLLLSRLPEPRIR